MLARLSVLSLAVAAFPAAQLVGWYLAWQERDTPPLELPMPQAGRHRALSAEHGAMRHDLGVLARERAS